MKLLPLTGLRNGHKGFIVGYAKIDDEDYEKFKNFSWNIKKASAKNYVFNSSIGMLHKALMNCPKNMQVDHKNGDGLDNRKSNLRICTFGENLKNRKKYKNNTSGYKNIAFYKKNKKYYVIIQSDKKRYYIGNLKTIKEAVKVRNKLLKKYHGRFANFN